MTESPQGSSADSSQPRPRYGRGLLIALGLALFFLLGSAIQSAATLLSRLSGNDVMEAASGGAWSGPLARAIVYFLLALVILHVVFGLLVWLLAWATSVLSHTGRLKFGRMVILWFCLLAAGVIAYNGYWYPRTGIGAYYHEALARPIGPLSLGPAIYWAVAVGASVTLFTAIAVRLRRMLRIPTRRVGYAAGAIGLLAIGSAIAIGTVNGQGAARDEQRPHVILLGIDSLRLGELARFGGSGATPNLDAALAEADLIADATTPAARTFPSWAAILTGRAPRVTGARFNLAPRDRIEITPTIGDVLRAQGYRSVYATDEVRFANIDETYGFDQVVTPPIGAADFLVGTYNELPLSSLVVNTRIGEWLFPFSYANRGVASLFSPRSFLSRLEREVSFDGGPTFFVTHLTASHWPYYVYDTTMAQGEREHADDRPLYDIGLRTADAMFGSVLRMLERKGALDNAILVILSDHGEALALPGDAMLSNASRIDGLQVPITVVDAGHGQSVLSPVQYQVLLAFRSFGGAAGFEARGRTIVGGATVEDIAPTLLELLGVPGDPLSATGESMAAALRAPGPDVRAAEQDRVRYTETDLKVLPNAKDGVDEVGTAKQNSIFFEVVAATARLQVREKYVPLVISFKERAAFTEKLLLAALPVGPNAHTYLLIDKATSNGRVLLGPPDPGTAERALWDAMTEHFAGELHHPVSITADQLPDVDRAWMDFFREREAPVGQGVSQ